MNFEMPVLPGSPETAAASTATVEFTPPFPESTESVEQAGVSPFETQEPPAVAPSLEGPKPAAHLPLVTSRETASSQTGAAHVAVQASESVTVHVGSPSAANIGLSGCCPVTLRNDRQQVAGRPELTSQWQGAIYHFVSAEAKRQFDAQPEIYAPAHAGLDVTQASIQGQQLAGSLEHAVWYRRQLYLFHDATALKNFKTNPDYYARKQ
jgi:YHS domain-containing protein